MFETINQKPKVQDTSGHHNYIIYLHYPRVILRLAIENKCFISDRPIKHAGFPLVFELLPELIPYKPEIPYGYLTSHYGKSHFFHWKTRYFYGHFQ